ncbi:MAG: hypothetical protein N3B16_05415 [Candidatus Aminicenantes bacterium]|nr:hypothetical protein [Candidatus Aminicenantes bacterium]
MNQSKEFKAINILPLLLTTLLIIGVDLSSKNSDQRDDEILPFKLVNNKVEIIRDIWFDRNRNRSIPVKIYYPEKIRGPRPLIIFSHGLGGSREGYEYLGRFWAENGFISLHLQHPGSDEEVWKGKENPLLELRKAVIAPLNAVDRVKDVSFCLDQLEKINGQAAKIIKDLINFDKIGLAGHSFGAHTTLLAVGQVIVFPGGKEMSLADNRIKAAIPMSAPVPANRQFLKRIYSQIKVPCLHLTGTLDDSPLGETKAEERRIPFDYIQHSDQYLVIFKDGDHLIFSGRPRWALATGRGERDEKYQEIIKKLTLVFWKAYLEGDNKAKAWLREGGAEKMLVDIAFFEKKLLSKN